MISRIKKILLRMTLINWGVPVFWTQFPKEILTLKKDRWLLALPSLLLKCIYIYRHTYVYTYTYTYTHIYIYIYISIHNIWNMYIVFSSLPLLLLFDGLGKSPGGLALRIGWLAESSFLERILTKSYYYCVVDHCSVLGNITQMLGI